MPERPTSDDDVHLSDGLQLFRLPFVIPLHWKPSGQSS